VLWSRRYCLYVGPRDAVQDDDRFIETLFEGRGRWDNVRLGEIHFGDGMRGEARMSLMSEKLVQRSVRLRKA